MKKKMFALILCIALLLALLPQTSGVAESKLSFISINDTLPPELINTAVTYGDRVYVPYWLFTNYGFGISYVYFASASTAYLYSGDNQLFFELSTGKTYDGDDYPYSTPAIMQGGTIYLPLGFVCSFFGGMRYSSISGNEYGSILRITTGNEVLTDAEFLAAARNVMRTYYQNYNKLPAGTTPLPVWTPEQPTHQGDVVRLALLGLPGDDTLEQLQKLKLSAGFFLAADQARSAPDTVRRLACSGYGLGVYCPGGTAVEYRETVALLQELTRTHVTLTCLPEEAQTPAGAARLDWDVGSLQTEGLADAVYDFTAALETGGSDVTMVFPGDSAADGALGVLLYYLSSNGFTVVAPRVTDCVTREE